MPSHARRSAVATVLVADAAVAIRGDLSKFSGDLNKAKGQVDSLGTNLTNALSPKRALVGLAAGLAGAFAATKVVDFIGDTIAAASHMNETLSKTSVILGEEALPGLEEWAEAAASAFGQSKQQALDAASTFAIFGKSAGLSGEELVGFSTDLTELSSDFASFFDTSPEEAITAIGAALRGESEPIRRYGVLLDEATLRQRALKLGIIQTTKEALTPQQRVLAAQAEIFAQTSDAQGDFARTSEGLANTQRQIAAELENVKVEIGEELLPIMLKLAQWFKNDGIPMLRQFIKALGDMGNAIGGVIEWFGDIGQAWATVGMDFGDMGDRIHEVADGADSDFQTTKDKIKFYMLEMGMSFEDAADAAEAEFARIASGVSPAMIALETMPGGTRAVMEGMAAEVEAGSDAIVETMTDLPAKMADAMLAEQFELTDAVDELVKFMEEALSPAAQAFQAKAFLASQAYRDGMNSGIPSVVKKTEELRDEALIAIARRAGFSDAGMEIGKAWAAGVAAGILNNYYRVANAGASIRNLLGHSLPTEGPLQHPEKGGRSIAEAWIEKGLVAGLRAGLGDVTAALPTLSASGTIPASVAMGAAGAASGATINNTNNWHLTVGGVPYTFSTRDDFIKALDDLSGFGADGRLG